MDSDHAENIKSESLLFFIFLTLVLYGPKSKSTFPKSTFFLGLFGLFLHPLL